MRRNIRTTTGTDKRRNTCKEANGRWKTSCENISPTIIPCPDRVLPAACRMGRRRSRPKAGKRIPRTAVSIRSFFRPHTTPKAATEVTRARASINVPANVCSDNIGTANPILIERMSSTKRSTGLPKDKAYPERMPDCMAIGCGIPNCIASTNAVWLSVYSNGVRVDER